MASASAEIAACASSTEVIPHIFTLTVTSHLIPDLNKESLNQKEIPGVEIELTELSPECIFALPWPQSTRTGRSEQEEEV
jgi:hypothetical protein